MMDTVFWKIVEGVEGTLIGEFANYAASRSLAWTLIDLTPLRLQGLETSCLSGDAKWTEGFGVWLTFDGNSWHFGSCLWAFWCWGRRKVGGGGGDSCRSFEVGGWRRRRMPRGLHQAAPLSFQQLWRPISLPGPPVRLSTAGPCSYFVYEKGEK
jgi:hypothetical protein